MPTMTEIIAELRAKKDYRTLALFEINNRLVEIREELKKILIRIG